MNSIEPQDFNATPIADPDEIRRALKLLIPDSAVTELRVLGVSAAGYRRPHTVSGYFDDMERLIQAAVTHAPTAHGVYIVPNQVNPALLARASNKARAMGDRDPTTADHDITQRRWLLIDTDPVRPAGISSSDDEHNTALSRVHEIRDALRNDGWPEPIIADSGNGAHLLYAIDLPANDGGVIQRVLKALAFRFDDAVVQVDQTVYNPARIWKLYGTVARKGDSTEDRPHRLARLLNVPGSHLLVTPEQLESLAALTPTPVGISASLETSSSEFELERWIREHGLDVDGPLLWDKGQRWVFRVCPWNPDHRNRSAYIVQFSNGAIAAGCHHNGCADNTWHDLRKQFEPGWQARSASRSALSTPTNGSDDAVTDPADSAHQDSRPWINATVLDLPVVTEQAWLALGNANVPPTHFRQGGLLVRVDVGERGHPAITAVNESLLRSRLARVARWGRPKKAENGDLNWEHMLPPVHVVRDMLAVSAPGFPDLNRIVDAPIFSASGELQTQPGYHCESQTYYVPVGDVLIPPVPPKPTDRDLEQARQLLISDLLGDFPFVGGAELAHAVALMILPFVRELIDGPTPLHLIEKPSPGTGAGLLTEVLLLPALGRNAPIMSEGSDEDEWRKRVTAKLRSGASVIVIDNLRRRLDSSSVAAALTASVWEDRLLGASEILRLPVRCVWVATANNPALSNEITRRTIRIRLDAKLDQPWLRTGFRHPNLRRWAQEHRGELIWACLVLARAWQAAGCPRGSGSLGMYEDWAAVVGGIHEVAGIPGFLGNLSAFYAVNDADRQAWIVFLAAWWERFGSRPVSVSELLPVSQEVQPPLPLREGTERSQQTQLGVLLSRQRDRRFALIPRGSSPREVQLGDAGESSHSQRWILTPTRGDVVDLGGPFGTSPAQFARAEVQKLASTTSGVKVPKVPEVPEVSRVDEILDQPALIAPDLSNEWGEVS